MENDIKNELHKLIDTCDNEALLNEAREVLQTSGATKDWWDELTEEDKNLISEAEQEYEKDEFTSSKDLFRKFEEWKKK